MYRARTGGLSSGRLSKLMRRICHEVSKAVLQSFIQLGDACTRRAIARRD